MITALIGVHGRLEGRQFPLGTQPVTLGRGDTNDIVLSSRFASRSHAEVRREGGAFVLHDLDTDNGTWVNGARVNVQALEPGDEIRIDDEVFRLESWESRTVVGRIDDVISGASPDVLKVTVTGGGPVGLSFALLLEHLLGSRVAIRVYDRRWMRTSDGRIEWSTPEKGNIRREQVVTLQSRQYLRLPPYVQDRLFAPGAYSEMWPIGPDSISGAGPRNVPIKYIEDQLLALANDRSRITLVPDRFDAAEARDDLMDQHVLAICEGGRSRTREHFADRFGAPDTSMYQADGELVTDTVLGLRVRSELPDPMAVLLTVTQNRFLLNSLRGEGFLNMRLSDQEAQEAVGIDMSRQIFTGCIQAKPCVLERQPNGEFMCETHGTLFLPALLRGSALWARIQDGLRLFGVPEHQLQAVTGFRLEMAQRPRFTAQLYPRTPTTPGTFAVLLGDAGNAIHFWPGRGLNSGLASAISLARCLARSWRGLPLRDADFLRHEAVMAMLQYRHKTRAWRQMVTLDPTGHARTIKSQIAQGITEGELGTCDRQADLATLMERMRSTRARLEERLPELPDDASLLAQLEPLSDATLHTLARSGAWDTTNVGGEEVDVEWLLPDPSPVRETRATRVVTAEELAAADPRRMLRPRGGEQVSTAHEPGRR